MNESLVRYIAGLLLCAVIAVVAFTLREAGISRDLFLLISSSAGVSVSALLIALILQIRERVAQAIAPSAGEILMPIEALQAKLAGVWHWVAILYVAAVGIYWTVRMLAHGDVHILNLVYSLFLIPVFIGVDQWVQKLLAIVSGGSREIIELGQPDDTAPGAAIQLQEPERASVQTYVPLIKKSFRVMLVALFFFATLKLWGFDIAVGRLIARDVVTVFLVLIIGVIVWQLIKARIDQKLREEMPLADEDAEEGGGVGSRSATLLMLLRKFVFAVLFVIVALIILSSLGIDIAPLIAGAGPAGGVRICGPSTRAISRPWPSTRRTCAIAATTRSCSRRSSSRCRWSRRRSPCRCRASSRAWPTSSRWSCWRATAGATRCGCRCCGWWRAAC